MLLRSNVCRKHEQRSETREAWADAMFSRHAARPYYQPSVQEIIGPSAANYYFDFALHAVKYHHSSFTSLEDYVERTVGGRKRSKSRTVNLFDLPGASDIRVRARTHQGSRWHLPSLGCHVLLFQASR